MLVRVQEGRNEKERRKNSTQLRKGIVEVVN